MPSAKPNPLPPPIGPVRSGDRFGMRYAIVRRRAQTKPYFWFYTRHGTTRQERWTGVADEAYTTPTYMDAESLMDEARKWMGENDRLYLTRMQLEVLEVRDRSNRVLSVLESPQPTLPWE